MILFVGDESIFNNNSFFVDSFNLTSTDTTMSDSDLSEIPSDRDKLKSKKYKIYVISASQTGQ